MITFERLYVELGDKSHDKKLYRFTTNKKEKHFDLNQVKYSKDENDKVLVEEASVKDFLLVLTYTI